MVAALALAGGACGGDDDATDDADSGDNEWCNLMSGAALDTPQFDNLDIDDPESVENAFREVVGIMEEAADSAPDQIEDDVQVLVDQFREFLDQLEESDFNFSEIDQSALDNSEAEAANERISEFCGFDTDDATVDTGEGATVDTGDGDTGDLGDVSGTDEEIARQQMVNVFTVMGLTEEQANCVVDNIDLDEFGNAAADPSQYFDLFDDCGFNPGG
jgi:hypothetical protein